VRTNVDELLDHNETLVVVFLTYAQGLVGRIHQRAQIEQVEERCFRSDDSSPAVPTTRCNAHFKKGRSPANHSLRV
jgi:hypothetical protein